MESVAQITFEFSCLTCGANEHAKMLDSRGASGGASWENGPALDHFTVMWSGGMKVMATPVAATCKICHGPAKIKIL